MSHVFVNVGIPVPPPTLSVYVVFKLVYACSHVCGYMHRPAANTKGSPLYLLSQGLSEHAALRCSQFTLLWHQRQAAMPTRLLYAGARELNSCPHTCVVSTVSQASLQDSFELQILLPPLSEC